MRDAAVRDNDLSRLQAWAGQAAMLARAEPAAETARRLWTDAEALLR
jgi:nitronate monooxygenase